MVIKETSLCPYYYVFHTKGKGKGKVHPTTGHEGPEREQRYSCTLSLTSALERVGWSTPCPRRFTPRERPGTHCIGGWVGPRAGEMRKITPTPGSEPRTVQPVASRHTDWAIPSSYFTLRNKISEPTSFVRYFRKPYKNTGLFEMIVGVLTTCHTQYTWDSSICIFLFNRTTLQVFVT